MAQRPQVRQFKAATQANLSPVASPVDTYTRPAEQQTQASPLSQFVSAITPAIEAEANATKAERLKREREIETGKRTLQISQLEQAAKVMEAELDTDFALNKNDYLQMEVGDVLQKRRDYVSDYVEELRKTDIDPMLIDVFSLDMETVNTVFGKGTFEPAKFQYNQGKLDEKLKDAIRAQNDLSERAFEDGNKEALNQGAEIINTLVNNHFEANQDYYTRDRLNDILVDLMHDERVYRSTSALTTWGESTTLSRHQLGTSRNADKKSAIKAKQKSDAASGLTKRKEATVNRHLLNTLSSAFDGDVSGINLETDVVFQTSEGERFTQKLSKSDYAMFAGLPFAETMQTIAQLPTNTQAQADAKQAAMVDAERKNYLLHQRLGIDTAEITAAKRTGLPLWATGDLTAPELDAEGKVVYYKDNKIVPKNTEGAAPRYTNLEQAYGAYNEFLKAYKYLGQGGVEAMLPDTKSKDTFDFIRLSMDAGEEFRDAILKAQRYDSDTAPKLTIDPAELADLVDPSIFFKPYTDKDETRNLGIMKPLIEKRYSMIRSVNPSISEEDAKKMATSLTADTFDVAKNTDGSLSLIRKNKYLKEGRVDENIPTVNTLLEEAVSKPEFRAIINNALGTEDRVILSTFGVEGLPRTKEGFGLFVESNTTNDNMLNVFAAPLDMLGNIDVVKGMYQLPFGINLVSVAEQRKSNFIEKNVANFEQDVADGNEPMVTTEDDETPNYTPSTTTEGVDYEGFKDLASQSFDEFLEQPLVQDLKKSFSLDNEMLQSLWNMRPTLEGITRDFEDIGKALTGQDDQTSMLDTVEDTLASARTAIAREFGGVKQVAASTLIEDEGFSSTQYDDMGQPSVGHGLQVASLEPDERALIKDINNVQEDESRAVVQLKVEKTANYFSETVEGFENLPASAKSSMIQMGYQLGRFNVTKEWPKFMEAVKEAATYAEGSVEQASALLDAQFNMLYNVTKDGKIYATDWAKQTANRAKKVAEELVANIDIPSIMSEANASTMTIPSPKPRPKGTVLNSLDEKDPSSNIIAAPYKALFSNIVGKSLGIKADFGTKDIGEDTLAIIKQATANAEARGSKSVEYGDYPLTRRGLPVSSVIANFKDISGKRLSSTERKQMEEQVNAIYPNNPIGLAMFAYDLQTDPVLKAAGFVGGFSIQKDKSGKKFIKERWNFNNKSTSEGTIYKKMRAFFSEFAPITEDEGSQVYVELN